jgi:hypothetical protein
MIEIRRVPIHGCADFKELLLGERDAGSARAAARFACAEARVRR